MNLSNAHSNERHSHMLAHNYLALCYVEHADTAHILAECFWSFSSGTPSMDGMMQNSGLNIVDDNLFHGLSLSMR